MASKCEVALLEAKVVCSTSGSATTDGGDEYSTGSPLSVLAIESVSDSSGDIDGLGVELSFVIFA